MSININQNNVGVVALGDPQINTNIIDNSLPNKEINNVGADASVDPQTKEQIWQIEIPAINLTAQISEGTTGKVMAKSVGHFTNTSILNGNVGLAAHNRGYKMDYFAEIKNLQMGDKIIYKTQYGTKTYLVNTIEIIEDTDWSYLENTTNNRITLITCVMNNPKYRLCVQGIEEGNL